VSFRVVSRIFVQSPNSHSRSRSEMTFNSAACKRISRSGAYRATEIATRAEFFRILSASFPPLYPVSRLILLGNTLGRRTIFHASRWRFAKRNESRPKSRTLELVSFVLRFLLLLFLLLLLLRLILLLHRIGNLPKRSRKGSPALKSRHRSSVTVP